MEVRYSRFSDAPWYDEESKQNIIIGGVGGIGSWVSLFLSRIGHKLIIFDMDSVDETNLAGQLYRDEDIGKAKVKAVKDVCSMFTNNVIETNETEYTAESPSTSIVISCFDNMKARDIMFRRWVQALKFYRSKPETMDLYKKSLFIDGRMTAEQGHIYFVTPKTAMRYVDTLFSDEEAEPLPCSMKATTHNGSMIASQMVAGLNNHISNLNAGFEYRSVPFYINYMLETFMYNITL
jgi:hypothetical protein